MTTNLEHADVLKRAAELLRKHDSHAAAAECEAFADKLSAPAVEVGQVWVDSDSIAWTVLAVHNDRAWVTSGDLDEFCYLEYVTEHYTLQTPAPEVAALTADDISESVVDAYVGAYTAGRHRTGIAAAINKWRKEKGL